jgi:hypothetical protein
MGHTEGFTLFELKKLVTPFLVLEADLARLCRRHRSTPKGWWPCTALRSHSRLGVLCSQPLDTPFVDPGKIMPHNSVDTREFFTGQMHNNFAVAGLVANTTDKDELFLWAVWQYTSVSELARALETVNPLYRMSLAIRCAGRGKWTSHLRKSSETISGANRSETRGPGEIDHHRGVLEFRQMGQSLDADQVIVWTTVCSKIVRAVRETSAPAFRELIRLITRHQSSILSLLDWDEFATQHFITNHSADGYYIPQAEATADYRYPFYKTGNKTI